MNAAAHTNGYTNGHTNGGGHVTDFKELWKPSDGAKTLARFESMLAERRDLNNRLADLDKEIEQMRAELAAALNGKPSSVSPGIAITTPKPSPSSPSTPKLDITKALENEDGRTRRTLSEVLRYLEKQPGRKAHASAVAKQLGISTQAARFRFTRGVGLGLLRNHGNGVYGIR